MYAIVEIAGQQFKVEAGKKIFVHRLEAEEGKKIDFEQVLLIEEDGNIIIGEPTVKDARVEGMVIDHLRGDKVIVFKKKRKKGYRIKNGHRQNFTQVEIISINGKGSLKKTVAKKAEVKAEESVPIEETVKVKKSATKKTTEPKEKVTKKTAEKKPAEKKTAEKKPSSKKAPKAK
jgi:large subunit ribosomal protein L21